MPALSGIRILDMTQWEAGTSATQALAFMGAEVVKVEPPGRGDPGRSIGSTDLNSPYFVNWNSNKRSVVLDLDNEEGRGLLLRMLPLYDVFVENYGPGVVERLDLDYEVMKAIHPSLIYARVKGFGTSGPYAHYKCMDSVAQAASGILSTTGERDGPPVRPGATIGDSGTGVQLALAILAAYIQRTRTGEGQLIELSMQEALTYYMRSTIANGSDWGRRAVPRTGSGVGAMLNLYPCAPGGPNDYAYMMVINTRMWTSLCKAMGRPELPEDERFSRGAKRHQNQKELYEEIAKWTRQHTKHEVMKTLGDAGVPCSAVLDTKDLFNDPHLIERGFVQSVEHDLLGTVSLLGWPARMSASHVDMIAAPLLGQHTTEVLKEDLKLDDEALGRLREGGVIDG